MTLFCKRAMKALSRLLQTTYAYSIKGIALLTIFVLFKLIVGLNTTFIFKDDSDKISETFNRQ